MPPDYSQYWVKIKITKEQDASEAFRTFDEEVFLQNYPREALVLLVEGYIPQYTHNLHFGDKEAGENMKKVAEELMNKFQIDAEALLKAAERARIEDQ